MGTWRCAKGMHRSIGIDGCSVIQGEPPQATVRLDADGQVDGDGDGGACYSDSAEA